MSITGIRNFFGKRMHWLMVGLSIVMLLSMGLFFSNRAEGPVTGQDGGEVIAEVDGQNISLAELQGAIEAEEQQNRSQGTRITADGAFDIRAKALMSLVSMKALLAETDRRGINVDDDLVMTLVREKGAEQMQQMRDDLINQKKIKPNATAAEFKAAFREQYKQDPDKVLALNEERIQAALQDPAQKQQFYQQAALYALEKQLSGNVKATEADYMKDQEQVKFRRIQVMGTKHQNAKQRIEEIQKRLKAGESFDKLADEMGDDAAMPAMAGRPKEPKGTQFPMSRATLTMFPMYKPLADKGVGYVSDVITMGSDYGIYKVTEVKPGAPPDFATRKDFYLKQYQKQKGQQAVQDFMKDFTGKIKAEVRSTGWNLLYKYYADQQKMQISGTPMSPKDMVDLNLKYMRLAQEAVKDNDPVGEQVSLLLKLRTAKALSESADYKDIKGKEAARKLYEETLLKALDTWEDGNSRIMLAKQFTDSKEYDKAFYQLQTAAKNAYSVSNPADQSIHAQVAQEIKRLEMVKYNNAQLDKLRQSEAKYQADIMKYQMEQQAAQKRAQEEAKKQAEKAKADAAKAKANPPSTGTKPAPTPDTKTGG